MDGLSTENVLPAIKPATITSQTLICFSHLRWGFVYQRPQHLLSRAAAQYDVLYWEEPFFEQRDGPALVLCMPREKVTVAIPHLPYGLGEAEAVAAQQWLLEELVAERGAPTVLWYYTPMALAFSQHLAPQVVVYDCMDELSGFLGAPPAMHANEAALLRRADLVLAGGPSLCLAKRRSRPDTHLFPSSIDVAHFAAARGRAVQPPDQARLPHPRLGFFGVIDERMDLGLVAAMAASRPEWQLVMVGPVVKIDAAALPRAANIHWLGLRPYGDLPAYLSGWDVALLPFALNSATTFISPTKTPEYLAGGVPVVSTPIADVVATWGRRGLVEIADDVPTFIAAVERCLDMPNRSRWLAEVDTALSQSSWDHTWAQMAGLIAAVPPRHRRPGPISIRRPRHRVDAAP